MPMELAKTLLTVGLALLLSGCAALPAHRDGNVLFADHGDSDVMAGYHYSLGMLHLLDENHAQAISELEAALRHDPQSPSLAAELAFLYSERGETKKAAELLNRALVKLPGDVELLFLLAGAYVNLKDYPKAVAEYRKVIELDPGNVAAHMYLGTLYADQKNHSQALEMFKKVLSLRPDDPMGHYYLARILVELNQDDAAEGAFKKTLNVRPSFEAAVVELGLLYQKQKKNDLAITLYRKFIETHPLSTKVRIRLGDVLLKEKRFEEADRELQSVLRQNPAHPEFLPVIGLMYMDADRLGQAIAMFAAFLETHPGDHKIRFFLASAHEESKEYPLALEAFRMIPSDSEYYVDAQIHVGHILKKENKTDEAISALKRAVALKKHPGEYLYMLLATLHEDRREIAEAEQALREGLSVSPKSLDLLYSLGVLYEKTDRFEESIGQMRGILALDPDHADALNFIGYSYAERGIHLQEAEVMIRKALALKPDNAYITDSLGWVYFKQNRTDLAIRYLQEAVRLMPDDAAIAEHLGDVYVQTGRYREALELYRNAIQLNPAKETLQRKIGDLLEKGKP